MRHRARGLNHARQLLIDDKASLHHHADRQADQQRTDRAWSHQLARHSHKHQQHAEHLEQGKAGRHRAGRDGNRHQDWHHEHQQQSRKSGEAASVGSGQN